MRTVMVLLVALAGASARATPKTAVVAAGDCTDASLIGGVKDFRDTAGRLLGLKLLDPEMVLDIVRPRPTRSLADVERQVESARALFYGGQGDRALELVERALSELERASPEAQAWPVVQGALVLQALIYKNLDRPKDMQEAFRRIVRVEPTFRLDPDVHPPSTVAALETVKKEWARSRKASLHVRADTGPAATVFIDGRSVGTTPLKIDLTPGAYRVSLSAGAMVSFPHRVEMPREARLNVDLNFEGSLGQQVPLCFTGPDDGLAIKLAQLVAAEQVIVLRNSAKRGAPPYLSGALYLASTAQQERAGSVPPELLPQLATFLITGKDQAGVQRPNDAPKTGGVPPAVVDVPPLVAPPMPVAAVEAPLAPAPEGQGTTLTPARIISLTLIGAGVVGAVAGGLVYSSGETDRARLVGITDASGKLPPADLPVGQEALSLVSRIDANRLNAFVLMGAAGGAALAGLVGVVLFPATQANVSVSPQAGGAALQLSGRF